MHISNMDTNYITACRCKILSGAVLLSACAIFPSSVHLVHALGVCVGLHFLTPGGFPPPFNSVGAENSLTTKWGYILSKDSIHSLHLPLSILHTRYSDFY